MPALRSAYPTGNALQRALKTLRREGLRSFWFKLLSECGYRRLLLLERSLAEPMQDFTPGLPVAVALLGADEIDGYVAFRPDADRRDVVRRLEEGQMCCVARLDEAIVAACWIAVSPQFVRFVGCEIDVAPGEAHIYDKVTLAAYRGQGLSNALRHHYLPQLRQAGYHRATSAALPENTSSLRDDAKGGFRPYAVIGRIKIGPWQRHFRRRATLSKSNLR